MVFPVQKLLSNDASKKMLLYSRTLFFPNQSRSKMKKKQGFSHNEIKLLDSDHRRSVCKILSNTLEFLYSRIFISILPMNISGVYKETK